MIVEQRYYFAGAEAYFSTSGSDRLAEVERALQASPILQEAPTRRAHETFVEALASLDWQLNYRITLSWEHSEMPRRVDAVKSRVAAELTFGHYTRMAYPVFALFPMLHRKDLIDAGILAVPSMALSRRLSKAMSMGSFEQVVADLQARGESEMDVPTVVLGLAP